MSNKLEWNHTNSRDGMYLTEYKGKIFAIYFDPESSEYLLDEKIEDGWEIVDSLIKDSDDLELWPEEAFKKAEEIIFKYNRR